jgi:hypothetical protein
MRKSDPGNVCGELDAGLLQGGADRPNPIRL